jgi:hypothetical protein
MVSTNQADPIRASEAANIKCFKKLSMKNFDQNFINGYSSALIFQEREFFDY